MKRLSLVYACPSIVSLLFLAIQLYVVAADTPLTLACPSTTTEINTALSCSITASGTNLTIADVFVDPVDGLNTSLIASDQADTVILSLVFATSQSSTVTVRRATNSSELATAAIIATDTPDSFHVLCDFDFAALTGSTVPCAVTAKHGEQSVFIDWSRVQLACASLDSTAVACPTPPSTVNTSIRVVITSSLAQSVNLTATLNDAVGLYAVPFKAPATSAWVSCPPFANVSIAFDCTVSAVADGDLTLLPTLDLFAVDFINASCANSTVRLNATSAVFRFTCTPSALLEISFSAPTAAPADWNQRIQVFLIGVPSSVSIDCPDTGGLSEPITCIVTSSPPTYLLGSDLSLSAPTASVSVDPPLAATSFSVSFSSTRTQRAAIAVSVGALSATDFVDFFAVADTLVLDCEHVVAVNQTARCVLSAYANQTRTFLDPAVLQVSHNLPMEWDANFTKPFDNRTARGFELDFFLTVPRSTNATLFASSPNASTHSYVVVIDNGFDSTDINCESTRVEVTDTLLCTMRTLRIGVPVFQLSSAVRLRVANYTGTTLDTHSVQVSEVYPSIGQAFHIQVSSNVSQLIRLFASDKDSAGLPITFTTTPSNLSTFRCSESTFETTNTMATVYCQLVPRDSSGASIYIDIAAKSKLSAKVESFLAPHLGPHLSGWQSVASVLPGTEGAVTVANISVYFYPATSGVLVVSSGVDGVPSWIIESLPHAYSPEMGIAVDLSLDLNGDPSKASKATVAETISNLEVDQSRVLFSVQPLVCKIESACSFKFVITPSNDPNAPTSLDLARKLRMRMVNNDYKQPTQYLSSVDMKTEFVMSPQIMRPCGNGFITEETEYCADDEAGFLANIPAWALFLICTAAFTGFLAVLVFFWKRRMRMSAQWVPMEVRPSTGNSESGHGTFVITEELDPTE